MTSLQQLKHLFQAGEKIDSSALRPEILASWQRSFTYGITKDTVDNRVLPTQALAARIQQRQRFHDVALPVITDIYAFIKKSGFIMLLTDEDGYVTHMLGEGPVMQEALRNKLVPGCNRSERCWGTNGIGTVLVTGQPLQVFGEEHYCQRSAWWVCSGAPIFAPDGSIHGTVCICGERDKVTSHTLGIAVATADSISRQYKLQEAYDRLAAAQENLHVMIENSASGLLLVDREQTIRKVNSRGARMLQCRPEALIGQKLDTATSPDFAPGESKFSGRPAVLERNGQQLRFSVSQRISEGGDRIVSFEREEKLYRRIKGIIGSEAHFSIDDIIGGSSGLRSAVDLARVAAENDSNVLLLGESGTGKELFAQAIHNASARRDEPFVAINCGALPKSLIESELFGYEGGSFTGSRKEGRAGKFELANGGTIFLDEIGDMPFDVQVSLLRVLQNREVTRLGSDKSLRINVRVIAATNQDLLARIQQNMFRRDLYYRLNVFTIRIPPLRSRRQDVPLLASYFLQKHGRKNPECQALGFTEQATRHMAAYDWPGNVRELENVVERAVYLGHGPYIDVDDLLLEQEAAASVPPPASAPQLPTEAGSLSIKQTQRQKILQALQACDGDVTRAAALLEISRRTLYRRLNAYGLDYGRQWKQPE